MIRFLDAAGQAHLIYAVEIDGALYASEEIAAIVTAQMSDSGANSLCCGAHRITGAFCEVSGCGEKRTGTSPYCKKHAMRFKRHGDATLKLQPWDRKKEKHNAALD